METWADFSNLPSFFLIYKTMIFKARTYNLLKINFIFLLGFLLSGCEKKPPVPPHSDPRIEKQSLLTGIVQAYETNPEGDIDKIVLNLDSTKVKVHFPPHFAKNILEIAKKNAVVKVRVSSREDNFELISIAGEDHTRFFDAGKILPPKPSPGKDIVIKGHISDFIKNPENKITGFVMDRKTVILDPEEGNILAPLLIQAHQVEVTARERDKKEGVINILKFPPVRITEIKIDSIVYKLR